jgi:hypothetical protein
MGTKTYTYPGAQLHVGPALGNDTNAVYWALRAFIPICKNLYEYEPDQSAKREIVHIQSAAYGYSLKDFNWASKPTECWDVNVAKDPADSSFHLTSHYNKTTKFDTSSSYGLPSFPNTTSNWITLADICMHGFDTIQDDGLSVNITQ